MIAVTGYRTTIVRELANLVAPVEVQRIDADLARLDARFVMPPRATRFVLAAGLLYAKPLRLQSVEEVVASLAVNMVNVVRLCETILDTVEDARVCVIASESAFSGSFDHTYAMGKAGVVTYVGARRVKRSQLLVAIAPPIIADSGMTERRHDYPEVLARRRHVFARDVAANVYRHLYESSPGKNLVDRM